MAAIPTRYNGVQFRSRIEARWAVMFDLLGWRWEYEPVDLDGYIPDFVLVFPAGSVLVEVKSLMGVDNLINECSRKIDRSGWKSNNPNDALIVGATWNHDNEYWWPCLGAIRQSGCSSEWYEDGKLVVDNSPWWCEAAWIRCTDCHRISTYHHIGGWACIACGATGKIYGEAPEDEIAAMWAQAGNVVQWRAPR